VIAVITAKGDQMNTAIEDTSTAEKPKATKRGRVGGQGTHVAPKRGRAAKKASPAKKAPKAANERAIREGSKAAQVLDLLKRPEGAKLAELMKATGWQAHSVRGFLSGTISKKMGMAVASTKAEDGERTYSVKA